MKTLYGKSGVIEAIKILKLTESNREFIRMREEREKDIITTLFITPKVLIDQKGNWYPNRLEKRRK